MKLSEYATGNIIYQNVYPDNFNGIKDIDEDEKNIGHKNYHIDLKEKWFNGIHISVVAINSDKKEDFFLEISHNHIGFLFCLEGCFNCYKSDKKENCLSIGKNQQNITYGQLNNMVLSVTGKIQYVYIQLTQAYYYKLTNRAFENDLLVFTPFSITPEINLILYSLINQKYKGRLKRLFLESKIFELVIFYINRANNKPTGSFKEEDIDKILLVKQLLEDDLQSPGSLMELSRKAGINDYKLKKGFKELTGYTVFGYLYKIRMERAYYLLFREKKTVNEVAFLVGYKNAQHFIVAFKKQYNILPGSLNKS